MSETYMVMVLVPIVLLSNDPCAPRVTTPRRALSGRKIRSAYPVQCHPALGSYLIAAYFVPRRCARPRAGARRASAAAAPSGSVRAGGCERWEVARMSRVGPDAFALLVLTGPPDGRAPLVLGATVTLYVCGITPYDAAHVGHAFTYVAFDPLVRVLRRRGPPAISCQSGTGGDGA